MREDPKFHLGWVIGFLSEQRAPASPFGGVFRPSRTKQIGHALNCEDMARVTACDCVSHASEVVVLMGGQQRAVGVWLL